MVAQSGRDLLLKIDMNGTGLFESVAGLRATRISFNTQTVDTTCVASTDGWRELLAGAGAKSAAISGSGVFKDQGSDERIREVFFDGENPLFQIVVPDFGVIEGAFQVTSFEYSGAFDGEATFDISLASAGAIVFTAL